ncbi:hypothetical protein [Fibrobacter succinogenes]|uniref:hypothetical protein n=1 Tax=Fibrobacter succinogenes TaxID=833 RepID=UPI0015649B21|nr:hypothetical protein [Fibrobacter succinogenes]
MMVEFKKLFVVALTALACVGMWGCGDLKKDGPVEWDKERTIGKVIGFIDDSLVIVSDWRGWNQEKGTFVHDGGMASGIGHQGLRVYNYRVQEDGPRWADTLDNENTNDFTYLVGQLSDSVIWGGNGKESFSFWKLGQNPVVMNMAVSKDGCNTIFKQEKMRTWLNGKILLKGPLGAGGDSCQYAVLDTIAKTLTYKRLDDKLKWIEKCEDVRALGDDVACLAFDKINLAVFVLLNDEMSDSLSNSELELSKYGDVCFMGDILNFGGVIGSYNNGHVNIFSSADLVGLMFRNIGGESINY